MLVRCRRRLCGVSACVVGPRFSGGWLRGRLPVCFGRPWVARLEQGWLVGGSRRCGSFPARWSFLRAPLLGSLWPGQVGLWPCCVGVSLCFRRWVGLLRAGLSLRGSGCSARGVVRFEVVVGGFVAARGRGRVGPGPVCAAAPLRQGGALVCLFPPGRLWGRSVAGASVLPRVSPLGAWPGCVSCWLFALAPVGGAWRCRLPVVPVSVECRPLAAAWFRGRCPLVAGFSCGAPRCVSPGQRPWGVVRAPTV